MKSGAGTGAGGPHGGFIWVWVMAPEETEPLTEHRYMVFRLYGGWDVTGLQVSTGSHSSKS